MEKCLLVLDIILQDIWSSWVIEYYIDLLWNDSQVSLVESKRIKDAELTQNLLFELTWTYLAYKYTVKYLQASLLYAFDV